jgi:hypothetical protein
MTTYTLAAGGGAGAVPLLVKTLGDIVFVISGELTQQVEELVPCYSYDSG